MFETLLVFPGIPGSSVGIDAAVNPGLVSDQRLKLMTAQKELFRVATEKLRITKTNTLEDIFDMITEQ